MFKHLCYVKIILFAIFFLIQTSYAITIDKIIAFGDSLSDNGNIFALTSLAHKTMPLIPIIPKSPPYYQGRFSNGPVWIDQVSASMKVPLVNYAYGGAWAEPILDSQIHVPFGLGMQVNFFLMSAVLDLNRAKHLYVIWSGANDYIEGRADPDYATTNTIENIRNNIDWLIFYGAKNILVINIPDLGVVPQVIAKGPEFTAALHRLSQLHNKKFALMMKAEIENHPDLTIVQGDVTEFFNDIMSNPDKYHIKNVTQACYDGGYWFKDNALVDMREIEAVKEQLHFDILQSPSLKTAYLTAKLASMGYKPCSNPDEYLFWDQLHPTTAIHKIMAEIAVRVLNDKGIHS